MAAQTTPAGAAAAAPNVNAVPSPANAQHATGLMAKLNAQVAQASKEDYDDEFKRQQQVTDGGNINEKAKNYWEGEKTHNSNLKLYVFMVPGSSGLRYG